MATSVSQESIFASYAERITTLDRDEAGQELGQKNDSDHDFNRRKITQKEFGDLSVTGNLSTVQYGRWNGKSACLVRMRFQFSSGSHSLWRLREAKIMLEFTARPQSDPSNDPVVFNYGPKSLKSQPTPEHRKWHYTVQFSAEASVGPVTIGPTLEGGNEGSYTRIHGSSIEASDGGDSEHDDPNRVTFWVEEDEIQESSLPTDLRLACIIGYSMPFQCTVQVKAKTLLPMSMLWNGWPWSKDDPILLEPLVEFYDSGKDQAFLSDFESLSDADWKRLVTPDLDYRYACGDPNVLLIIANYEDKDLKCKMPREHGQINGYDY